MGTLGPPPIATFKFWNPMFQWQFIYYDAGPPYDHIQDYNTIQSKPAWYPEYIRWEYDPN